MIRSVLFFFALFFWQVSDAQVFIRVLGLPENTPENANIYVAGDFNNWNPADTNYQLKKGSDNFYSIKINPAKETIEYKFTLGSWSRVECNNDGSDTQNRISQTNGIDTLQVTIQAWKNEQRVSTKQPNVYIVENFYMPQLNRYRRIWIYLPPDYEQTTMHYPAVYMHDAQNLFDNLTSFSGEWNVDEALNSIFEKNGTDAIVVGIDHGDSLRLEELTPWPNEKYGGGNGGLYARFIVETLKPFIDGKYRTLTNRENTAIMGSSLGGLESFYMALHYSGVFGKAGVFSPSFWFSDECYNMAASYEKKHPLKMFILAGGMEGDSLEVKVKKMADILKAKGFTDDELKLKIVPEGRHNEAFWREEFPEVFLWLFKKD